MAKLTKERVLNVCKYVNAGMLPSIAAKKEGIALAKQLIESGIIYKDPITGKWQAIMRIHDARYEKFIQLYKIWRKECRDSVKLLRKETAEIAHTHTKVGMFRRIWNSIFG
jgi:hypothetical protein